MSRIKNDKIHILYLIPSLSLGGAEVQLLELVKGLNKDQFNITVGAFYSNGQLSADFLSVPGINVQFFGKKHELDFLWLWRLGAYLRAHRVDIIDMWNTSAKTVGMLSAWAFSIAHTVVRERSAHNLYTSYGSILYTLLDRILARYATIAIANSEAGRLFAIAKGIKPEKIRVIYNGINSPKMIPKRPGSQVRADLGINFNAPVVGMVARLVVEKDPFTFLQAAKIVVSADSKVKILLVGDGPLYNVSQEMTESLGIYDNVVFTGARDDIPEFINIMDVVVLSSSVTEGCSNSILEAMFMGKPVVATDVGGNPELVADGRTGLLVPPKMPNAMAAAIMTLLKDPNLAHCMGERAKVESDNRFASQTILKQYEILYEKLMYQKHTMHKNAP